MRRGPSAGSSAFARPAPRWQRLLLPAVLTALLPAAGLFAVLPTGPENPYLMILVEEVNTRPDRELAASVPSLAEWLGGSSEPRVILDTAAQSLEAPDLSLPRDAEGLLLYRRSLLDRIIDEHLQVLAFRRSGRISMEPAGGLGGTAPVGAETVLPGSVQIRSGDRDSGRIEGGVGGITFALAPGEDWSALWHRRSADGALQLLYPDQPAWEAALPSLLAGGEPVTLLRIHHLGWWPRSGLRGGRR